MVGVWYGSEGMMRGGNSAGDQMCGQRMGGSIGWEKLTDPRKETNKSDLTGPKEKR